MSRDVTVLSLEAVLTAFNNTSSNWTKEELRQFVQDWFYPVGSDLLEWTPTGVNIFVEAILYYLVIIPALRFWMKLKTMISETGASL